MSKNVLKQTKLCDAQKLGSLNHCVKGVSAHKYCKRLRQKDAFPALD